MSSQLATSYDFAVRHDPATLVDLDRYPIHDVAGRYGRADARAH